MHTIFEAVKGIEQKTGKTFGGKKNPLLVSVRSGARVSMPGMMDTILNLGLNDVTCAALAKETNNERFAMDSYRRFILMFTNIAKGHPRDDMDKMLDDLKKKNGYKLDTEVTAEQLKDLVAKYKEYYKKTFGEEFPSDPKVQLIEAVTAVGNVHDFFHRHRIQRKSHLHFTRINSTLQFLIATQTTYEVNAFVTA